jgi:hypothetical protein
MTKVDNVSCQKSAMDEALNMTPIFETAVRVGVVNGVEQTPNGNTNREEGEGWRGEGRGVNERKKRKNAVEVFAPVSFHSRSEQMTARMVDGLCNACRDWRT